MTVKVVAKPGEELPPVEIIAQSIVDLAEGMRRLETSRLTQRALVTLLNDHTKVPRGDIGKILLALRDLESLFLKPKPKALPK